MTKAALEPWPFSSQASMLTSKPARQTVEQTTKSTNKQYLIVKNILH